MRLLQEGVNGAGIGSALHVFGARDGREGMSVLTFSKDLMNSSS